MNIAKINKEFRDLYVIKPKRIYLEIISYAFIAWSSYLTAVITQNILFLAITIVFMYRGLSFIHEVSHLDRQVKGMQSLFNHLIGYLNKVPAYSMKTHRYHHGLSTFGEITDPEYEKWPSRPKFHLARPLVFSFFYPLVLTIRFGIWPVINFCLPRKIQMATYKKISSFVMNLNYIRPYDEKDFNDYKKEDLWCVFYFVLFIAATMYYGNFIVAFSYWYGIMVIMSILNTYRALVAHRYQSHLKKEQDPQLKQLNDSVTIDGGLLTAIWAPIGLRYHSTHHFLPTLPYYS